MTVRFSMLSTFPPTPCGLATFAQALCAELVAAGGDVHRVRVLDHPGLDVTPGTTPWVTTDSRSRAHAVAALNSADVAIVQHEYGIFGGADGADVVALLAEVEVPIIVVLHTVLANPSLHQHRVLAEVIDAADVVVTMTETAHRRLLAGWRIEASKVRIIAHGAADNRGPATERSPGAPATILTWGLMGPGKGIEWALAALALVDDVDPLPRYRVVGETHPRVVENSGEAYRVGLTTQVASLGLGGRVSLEDDYLDEASLRRVIRAADIVLLPYDSRDQVTSGVLTEAVVAGKPVISTRFPHAVELLSDGVGLLVPQRDPAAIAAALHRVLTEPGLAESMSVRASALAPALLWSGVAAQYALLARTLARPSSLSVA